MRVTSIKHITGDNWLIVYYYQLPCMCKEVRNTITLKSKDKPTEAEVLAILISPPVIEDKENEDND